MTQLRSVTRTLPGRLTTLPSMGNPSPLAPSRLKSRPGVLTPAHPIPYLGIASDDDLSPCSRGPTTTHCLARLCQRFISLKTPRASPSLPARSVAGTMSSCIEANLPRSSAPIPHFRQDMDRLVSNFGQITFRSYYARGYRSPCTNPAQPA